MTRKETRWNFYGNGATDRDTPGEAGTCGKRQACFYEPADLKAARQKLMGHLAGHRPEQPFDQGVRLMVKWCFPKGKHADGEYRITKPDTDNLQKLLKDCMTACGFWKDDALVAAEMVEKFWAEIPGIYVRIEEI